MFSFLKRRDLKIYPKNPIGDELYSTFPKPEKLPEKAGLWYDIYFDNEDDADRMTAHLENRRIDMTRDHDEANRDEGLGPWNIDCELEVRARYMDLSLAHAEMERVVRSLNGKIEGWMIMPLDEE